MHASALRVAAGLAALLAAPTSAQVPTFSICQNPANFQGSTVIGSGSTGAQCSQVVSFFQSGLSSSANCNNPQPNSNTTWRTSLWSIAGSCCSDGLPNTICGQLQTVCASPSQLQGSVTPQTYGGSTTCAQISTTIIPEVLRSGCNGTAFGVPNIPVSFHLRLAATECCSGGVQNVNQICGPPPVVGSMCANPAHYTPNVRSNTFNASCAQVQSNFVNGFLYASNASCSNPLPGAGSLTLGAAFALAASDCCGGNPIGSTCAAGRMSVCQSPGDFIPSNNISFSPTDSNPCSNFRVLYGINASMCDGPFPGGNSSDGGTVRQILSFAGRDCCTGQRLNLLCGSPAPTPPPTPLPARVGPTFACGGSFSAWVVGSPGSSNCSGGQPIAGGGNLPICGGYPGDNGRTEYAFLISNGGICVSFRSIAACRAASNNLTSILATADFDGVVSGLPDNGQCFLRANTCSRYAFAGGVSVVQHTQCGAAPNPTPGSMCATASDFNTSGVVFNQSCTRWQTTFLNVDLYGHPGVCGLRPPNSQSTWQVIFSGVASTCCGGNPISATCGVGRTSVCADPATFQGSNIITGAGNPFPCANAPFVYNLTASRCQQPFQISPDDPPGDGSLSTAQILSMLGSGCCSNGVGLATCGSIAPSPPPSPPPPRVGPTYACGGNFSVYGITSPGGLQCRGTPFVNTTFSGGVCGSYDEDNATQYGFTISNGGMCSGFTSFTRCMAAANNVGSLVTGTPLSNFAPGEPSAQCFLQQDACARYSLVGGVTLRTTTACGPAPNPTVGSMCATPTDYTPNANVLAITCATMQAYMLQNDVYGHPSLCPALVPNEDSLVWGAWFEVVANECCGGNPISNTCASGRVAPCSTASAFVAGNNVTFGDQDGFPCTRAAGLLYGKTASDCNGPITSDGSTPVGIVTALIGRDCCGGATNSLCGSLAPTPAPVQQPPRTGATIPCPGYFRAYYLTSPGAGTCTGAPFIEQTVTSVCGPYTAPNNKTEYGFVISNGGACVGFNATAECMTASNNLAAIVGGTNVNSYTTSGNANCYLATQHGCNRFPTSLTSAVTVPMCSDAPTSLAPTVAGGTHAPTSTRAPTVVGGTFPPSLAPTPSVAPTFAPTASPATAGSSNSGSSSAGGDLIPIIAVVVVTVIILVGLLVYYNKSQAASAEKKRSTMVNPTYEQP